MTAMAQVRPTPPPTREPGAASAAPTEAPATPAQTPSLSSPVLGSWTFRARSADREIGGGLRFFNQRSALAGAYVAPSGRETPLTGVNVQGEKISFGIPGAVGTWQLIGVLSGDRINGTFETISGIVPWTAVRGAPPASSSPAPAVSPTSR
ncbi:MAG: hypothetical protein ABR610_01755 [Thermoanaerobaculia bacterium]